MSSDITRELIKGLPRLFVKYQTDAGRMSDVLLLPQLMSLDMYLEMRMMTVSPLVLIMTCKIEQHPRRTPTCGTM